MKQLVRVFIVIAALSIGSAAQNDWIGSYSFDEDGGKTAGGTAIFISHQLDVYEGGEGLAATLESNGYQTSANLICTAKVEGAKLLIIFETYGENNMFEPYKQGDLLLTLERKMEKGKPVVITHWVKFTPAIEKNHKSGKVYFQKNLQK